MKRRRLMRKVRRTLTGTTFMACTVGTLAAIICFNLLWAGTQMEFLKVAAFAFFAGLAGTCGYVMVVEDPRDKYFRVRHE